MAHKKGKALVIKNGAKMPIPKGPRTRKGKGKGGRRKR